MMMMAVVMLKSSGGHTTNKPTDHLPTKTQSLDKQQPKPEWYQKNQRTKKTRLDSTTKRTTKKLCIRKSSASQAKPTPTYTHTYTTKQEQIEEVEVVNEKWPR